MRVVSPAMIDPKQTIVVDFIVLSEKAPRATGPASGPSIGCRPRERERERLANLDKADPDRARTPGAGEGPRGDSRRVLVVYWLFIGRLFFFEGVSLICSSRCAFETRDTEHHSDRLEGSRVEAATSPFAPVCYAVLYCPLILEYTVSQSVRKHRRR